MNRKAFQNKIKEEIGQTYFEGKNGKSEQYAVISAREPKYEDREFFIKNCGLSGIKISFYNTSLNRKQTIENIYHWSDAYDILYLGITNPKKICYRDENAKVVSIGKTLGKKHYDFIWEPERRIWDISDDMLNIAIQLVEYNYIDPFDETKFEKSADGEIIKYYIHGKVSCIENPSRQILLDVMEQRFTDDDETKTIEDEGFYLNWTGSLVNKCIDNYCNEFSCILALCGYLEYAANNEFLYDLIEERVNKRKEYNMPCGPFSFTWRPEDGLKLVDESRFNLAMQMVEHDLIQVYKDLADENRVQIGINRWCCFRGENTDNQETTTGLIACEVEKNLSTSDVKIITIYADESLRKSPVQGCPKDCLMSQNCVYYYAGYIKFLQESGREDIIQADREWFKQNKKASEEAMKSSFGFSLPTDLFMDSSEELFEVAELLQEKNYVSLYRRLNEHNNVMIKVEEDRVYHGKDLAELKRDVRNNKINYSRWGRCFAGYPDYNYDRDMIPQHVALAGYIDYLRRTGQYEVYKERVEKRRQETAKSFGVSQSEIPALDKVIAVIENERKDSSLYCIIEGERGVGEQKIVKQIISLLAQKGKIDDSEPERCTFDDIASRLGYKALHQLGSGASENQFSVYNNFEKRKLYVLEGLKEFIYDTKSATDGDGSKVSHLIELLGRYESQTYIIIMGEKKYVEHFMELSPKIKFLFGNYVIPIKNLTAEKMYEVFCSKLAESLKGQLDVDFKNKFLDYIAMNHKLLPLSNQELANYLSDYANNQKTLVLPPDVYRKKSAKEMLETVIGMENVKKKAYEFEKYAIFLRRAEMDGMMLPNSNMHMLFTGNPGTGKTMVARIIGQMLFDLGIIEENRITEVETKDLKSPYVGESAIKTGKVIDKAMGGVLFIDEAYSIGKDTAGKETIATLIKAMEDHKDKFVVIFAGYEKEMNEFLNINSGITSRIGYKFHFDDYTVDELLQMFNVKMKNAGFEFEPNILDTVREICEHFYGKKNFGNGRFIDKIMQNVILKHSTKEIENDSINYITKDDIPSIEALVSTDVVEHKNYREQLNEFIGMDNVKEKVLQFAKFVEFQQLAKKAGAKIPAENMHMIFNGNPGTGKTTIARIMVDLLYDIGVIKENKLIEVERKDLVAEYIGQTALKTAEVIERALDGVLFVDEAYTLASNGAGNDFGAEAIATLIKAMEDHKNDLIIIFAGYKDEMRQFVNANPGIASRIGNSFDFEDYSSDELVQMYQRKMEKAGFFVSDGALEKVKILVEYFSKKKNFGNGRFIGKLQQETLMRHSRYIREDKSNLLSIDVVDIPEISDINNTARKLEKSSDFDHIIGMANVKEKLKEFENLVNFRVVAREHGLTVPNFNMHMIFTGNPGTGKTTIARIIAQKLYDIGIVMEKKLVEVERKDLVAGYIGQTAQKVNEVVEKAIGGILFIDEAYALTPKSERDFGGEAIATLIKAMEDHKNNLVVIFAGYKDEMNDFVDANPGIASRIGFTFHFEDYDACELKEIFVSKMKSNGFSLTEQAQRKSENLMKFFCHMKNFGNGRFVDRIVQNTLALHAKNYKIDSVEVVDENDIPEIEDIANIMNRSETMITSERISDEEHKRVAIHEIGHALVQCKLFPDSAINKIAINVESNGNLGYMEQKSDFGIQNTKITYKNSITVLMAGLAAEKVFFGDYADGGSGDIKAAATRANTMITQCGMSKYGFAGSSNEIEVLHEINEILKEGFDNAIQIIEVNRLNMNRAVDFLLEKRKITGNDLKSILLL